MKTLIAGKGEIGDALGKVLADYSPAFIDPPRGLFQDGEFDILHICFSCSTSDIELFISTVKEYQERFNPKYTVVHSTVPYGTCRKLGAIHSPVIGQHPHLEESIMTFPKFLAGDGASKVADYFRRVGIKVILFDAPETSETGKLFLTEYYRECIEFAKRVKKYCEKHDLSFHEVYTIMNTAYNEGYEKLGYPEFRRPVLQPIMTEMWGHCLLPNKELIKIDE